MRKNTSGHRPKKATRQAKVFTPVEMNHLMYLLAENEQQGWYFAPKDQYWKRHERIKAKLLTL